MKKRRSKLFAMILMAVIFFEIIPLPANLFAADESGFPIVIYDSSTVPGYDQYYPTSTPSLDIQIKEYQNYKVGSWKLIKNGTVDKGQIGQHTTGNIHIDAISADPTTLTGETRSYMSTALWRQQSGKSWQIGTSSGSFTFTALASTFSGGVSQYPGAIPAVDDNGHLIPENLRYAGDGSAAVWSDKLPPPLFKDAETHAVANVNIDPSSIHISSKPEAVQGGIIYDYWGKGQDGFGYIKAHKMLNSSNSISFIDYEPDNSLPQPIEGRTYYFDSTTSWEATTYVLNYHLEVNYVKINSTKPDLVADSITASTSTIQVGSPATYTATFHNAGLDITTPFNVKVMEGSTVLALQSLPTASDGVSQSITFNYTFSSSMSKTFTLLVDSAAAVDEENESNNTITQTFTPGAPPQTTFTGDFDVQPNTIAWRDSFTLHPRDFDLQACTYQSHAYKIERDGTTYITPDIVGMNTDSSYTYATYPSVIGIGIHQISMNIKTSCGETGWIHTQTLTINGPTDNHPPQFEIGFVRPTAQTAPIHEVMQRTVLNLIYINDPTIPTPTDPDGDTLTFTGFSLDGESSFIQSLSSKSLGGDGYHNITMDTPGYHHVCGIMRDSFGATATACTYINVAPPNPIPVAVCPPPVIENHPIASNLFDSSQSYSTLGRSINHSRDEWTNRQSSYTNGTGSNVTYQVSLNVYDSAGLKSLTPGTCQIIVKPDLPPIAKLQVPSVGIRNASVVILNQSYSPDGDTIVAAQYKYKYDAANNGFADDAWQTTSGSLAKFDFYPSKVGKYLFYTKVTEAYGKWGDTSSTAQSTITLDVINNAPEVSFQMEGNNPQPNLDPYTTVPASTMLGWPVFETNGTKQVLDKNNLWKVSNGSLVGGEGRNFGPVQQFIANTSPSGYGAPASTIVALPFHSNGYGANRLSPWRSAISYDEALSYPLIDESTGKYQAFFKPNMMKIRSTKKYILYNSWNGVLSALDPKKISPITDVWKSYSPPDSIVQYTNGSPFAYKIIGVKDYEIADQNLYAILNSDPYTIHVYNAATGAQIRTFYTPSAHFIVNNFITSIGNNVYATVNDLGVNGKSVLYKLTTDLQISAKVIVNAPAPVAAFAVNNYTYEFLSSFYLDQYGNIYVYEGYHNGYSYEDINITKYRSDLTLAWRRYLSTASKAYPWDYDISYQYNPNGDKQIPLFMNPIGNELYAQTYDSNGVYGDQYKKVVTVLDANTGGVKNTLAEAAGNDLSLFSLHNENQFTRTEPLQTRFFLDFNGTKHAGDNSTVTADGNRTSFIGGCNLGSKVGTYNTDMTQTNVRAGSNTVYNNSGTAIGQIGSVTGYDCSNVNQLFGEYFGDGVYVSVTNQNNPNGLSYFLNISVGTPTTSPNVVKGWTNGQFYSSGTLDNADVRFTYKMQDVDYDKEWLGFSFRMQDTRNRYAFETDGYHVVLAKYTNGSRSVLASGTYPMQDKTDYAIRLTFSGSEMNLWLNNIPILSAADSTFTNGRYGYFDDKSFVTFSGLRYKPVSASGDVWSSQYAIWDSGTAKADVKYDNILFTDPENDPMAGSYQWTIQHTPRFLDNQGVSALNGQTFSSPQLHFDKVGDYLVTLKAEDDPNPTYRMPSMAFDGYRKVSNPFVEKVTVHRRPISQFTVSQATDGKVIWTDYSRDPDRYISATSYSTESTGIDYKATKGIMEKKFYYITPSGSYVEEKLVAPQEIGSYEIGLAVKDEYGAWSGWYVLTLNSGKIAALNTPPHPFFTTSAINTFRGVPITFNSEAWDAEDGNRDQIAHAYYLRNLNDIADALASTSRRDWVKTFNSVGTFNVRQTVTDSAGAEASYQLQVTIHNQLPVTNVTLPASTDQNAPERFKVLRPPFKWTYGDAEGDPETKYQIKIYRYGGFLQVDSGERNGNALTWMPGSDLPEKVNMYVQARSFDGYDWGNWSSAKFFYIDTNTPPVADIDWLPKPIFEGDTLNLLDQSSDADGDSLTYQWEITQPSGDVSHLMGKEPVIAGVKPGKYAVALTVSDGKDEASISKWVTVLPLTISSSVEHTPEWQSFHEEAGDETATDPKDFYAGEVFVLHTISAPAPVDKVTAWLDTTGIDNKRLYTEVELHQTGNAAHFQADFLDERWSSLTEGLPEGIETIRFNIQYANGIQKETEIPVRIIGNVLQTVRVHRRQ